jgi:hypothetical protein
VIFNRSGEGAGGFLLLMLAALVLTAVFLEVAAALSAGDRRRALALALVVWFVAVVLFDVAALGLASLLPSGAASRVLIVGVLVNPVDAVRTGTLLAIEGSGAFGPASWPSCASLADPRARCSSSCRRCSSVRPAGIAGDPSACAGPAEPRGDGGIPADGSATSFGPSPSPSSTAAGGSSSSHRPGLLVVRRAQAPLAVAAILAFLAPSAQARSSIGGGLGRQGHCSPADRLRVRRGSRGRVRYRDDAR